MSKATPIALLVGSLILAAAVAYHAQASRYRIQPLGNGMLVRLDTHTGATQVCIPQRAGDGETYQIPCTGKHGSE